MGDPLEKPKKKLLQAEEYSERNLLLISAKKGHRKMQTPMWEVHGKFVRARHLF